MKSMARISLAKKLRLDGSFFCGEGEDFGGLAVLGRRAGRCSYQDIGVLADGLSALGVRESTQGKGVLARGDWPAFRTLARDGIIAGVHHEMDGNPANLKRFARQ